MSVSKISDNGKYTILIVEDSPTQAERLKYLLEKQDYTIILAHNGIEALEILAVNHPTLVISDIVMPGMDGYELCKTIKSKENLKDLPVMLLTSLTDPEDVVKGLLCGADNFVTKPYNEKVLLSQIEYILVNKKIRDTHFAEMGIDIYFSGKKHQITSSRLQIIDLLLSTYENAIQKKYEVEQALYDLTVTQNELKALNENLEEKVLERTRRIEQLNELLRVIRNINQLIVKTHNRDHLIQRACEIFTASKIFSSAWIYLLDDKGKVTDIVGSGHGKEFESFKSDLMNGIFPPCIQQIVTKDEVVIIPEPIKSCPGCLLSTNKSNRLVFSVALRAGDTTFGILNVGSRMSEPNDEEVGLFEEVAGDIAYGLNNIKLETKHLLALEQVKENEHKFRLIWEKSADGMRLTDADGIVRMVNDAYCKLVEMEKKDLENKPLSIVYSQEIREKTLLHYKERFQASKIETFLESEMVLWNGRKIWLELSNSFYKIENQPQLLLTIFHDITKRKTALNEKEKLQAQLQQSQKMEAIGRLAGGIAHDFNNMLTIIQGNAQLGMMNSEPAHPLYHNFQQIISASEKAATLTRQMLTFSRKQTVEFHPVKLNHVIEDMNKMLRRLIGENIQVVTNLQSDLRLIKADEGYLEQVLMNLIVNARDAMPDGGQINITTKNIVLDRYAGKNLPESRSGNFVLLTVEDSGCGICVENIEKIFEPFFTTKESGKGTGLGLAMVYGIVKQHEGWINVYSETGKGTTFKIYLPALAETKKGRESVEQQKWITDEKGRGERILLVEDDPSVCNFAAFVLRENGYEVFTASDGQKAGEMFDTYAGNFKLVLCDFILPDKNGIEVADQMRLKVTDLPVLLSSGYTEEKVTQSLITEKGYHFIQKPYSITDLLTMVKKMLNDGKV
ncbi:MAG: response regulator [Candidatus Marinimicrobia bacterium]|nr:response regulator [Candidatus Neomarinimicrobiota bacterium]